MIVDLLQQTHGVEFGDDSFARVETVHVRIAVWQAAVDLVVHRTVDVEHLGAGQDAGVLVEDVDQRQVVALADLIVVEVMSRGDFYAAGAKFEVDVVVGDDRDQAVHQRQHDVAADEVLVALVLGVHRDCGVAQHGFRPGGRYDQVILAIGCLATICQRIAQVPEVTFLIMVFDFKIGNRGVQLGIPVDQALAAVDQAVLVQPHEGFFDSLGKPLVHGEALTRPVHRGAQAANLPGDVTAGLFFPLPHLVEELLAPQVMTADALSAKLTLDHHLGGNAGVIGAGLPQGVATLHPPETDQCIHDGVVEAMAHMQAAGDVRRRDHDGVGLA